METARGTTREEEIARLAHRIDRFEKYSQPHSELMAALAVGLARHMGLAQADIAAIREAALLHDVGLFALSPAYHSIQGPLGFNERMDLWRHPVIGEQQMAKTEATRYAQLLVRWHHERWNGSGYPDSLAFEDIPIGARLLYAVELYSALASDRPYRAALPDDELIARLKASAGVECDPTVVKTLLALLEEINQVLATPDVPAVVEGGASQHHPQFFEPFLAAVPNQPGVEDPEQARSSQAAVGQVNPLVENTPAEPLTSPLEPVAAPVVSAARPLLPPVNAIISQIDANSPAAGEQAEWRRWRPSRYNKKSLLGFEASVLRQITFRSIAVAFSGGTRLDWYLKAWGKQILSNDPRAWASAVSKATIQARAPLDEGHIARLLEDVYVPGAWLRNRALSRWFSETDSWWLDNLRRNIEAADDEIVKAQALSLGLQVGDYALSFEDETRELKRPLTAVFWQLAGRGFSDPEGHHNNQVFCMPAREFILRAHAEILLYLDLPAAHAEQAGSEARARWRECWVTGCETTDADDLLRLTTIPQSKQAYLAMVDRLLRAAAHIRTWAVGYQEIGLASAHEISDLIKEHRPVTATYSKDLTEVAGGLRNYIIVAQKSEEKR